MANDFVRNIKGVRNINNLSRNITTENDLISTNDNEVYVVTNGGYRKITGVETKEIKQLKTDVSNVKLQSDTNTLNISDLTGDIETNTSEIETLKTLTDNNTSEIETLKTSTDNNKSEIETLKTSTDNNTSEIDLLKNKIEDIEININSLNQNIKTLNEYNEVKTFKDIDLMDKNSLNTLPLGVNYLISADNKPTEMKTNNGWLTVHYGNNVKRLLFQPYSEGRTYYNYIISDTLGEWQ